MADVGRDSVIGAGAVVTKPIPDRVLAAGVPARVIRGREPHDRLEELAS
jgi:acetyltransferase-like isoleucine patch superfamily enzyme